MSNSRIFCIAVALLFWPGMYKMLNQMQAHGIEGPARVSTALFFTLAILAFCGIAAVAVFGDRR